jgi:hypothetical protein
VLGHVQVKSVNDKPVRNLKELVAEVDGTADKFLRFDLEYNQVLHAAPCHDIMTMYFSPCLCCSFSAIREAAVSLGSS